MKEDQRRWMTFTLFEEMYGTTAIDFIKRSACPHIMDKRLIYASPCTPINRSAGVKGSAMTIKE